MEVLAPTTRAAYVTSLELATPEAASDLVGRRSVAALRRADGAAAAFVDAGSAVTFVEGISVERQNDVLDSTLLAQLAANKKYDRERQTEQWYGYYREVLENLGWVVGGFGFQRYEASGTSVRMDKAALEIIKAAATGNELAILTAALDALDKANPDSDQIVLFDANGSQGEGGNFQLATAQQDTSGNVAMALGAFYFKADEHKGRFLFWSWSTQSINFYFSTQRVVLNERIYATVRQAVIDKLGRTRQDFVAGIDI